MLVKSSLRFVAVAAAFCAALALTACGSGDPLPAQQAGTVVGAAGGTVTAPNGAQVVIPAGALAGDVTIGIEVVAAGAVPALPINTNSVGLFLALTPHGQTFAQPVTVTIPFDPAQVPAGAQLTLFKTGNGASGPWVEVAGATVAGNALTAQVTGFSIFTVALLPQITRQPQNTSVAVGQAATFSVFAIGFNPPFTFQWQRSDDGGTTFADITGATNSSYTTAATMFADANVGGDNGARFQAIVSNAGGSITSAAATLTVTLSIGAPTITTQPQDQTVNVGANVRFSCLASGTNVSYQWSLSVTIPVPGQIQPFNDIPGETSPDLDLNNVRTDQTADYRCRATNSAGFADSNPARLIVTLVSPPPPPGCAVTFSDAGAALLPGSCFNPTTSGIASSPSFTSMQWQQSDQVVIEALSDAGSTVIRTLIVRRISPPFASWSAVAASGIPRITRSGNLINFQNVSLPQDPTVGNPGGGATTLILNGALTVPTPAASGLTGTWISTYQCTGTGGNFSGQDTLTVTQTGANVIFTSQPVAGSFSGTLSGNTMTYAGGGPGYTESGTWTMQGANNFSKTSSYTRTDGSGGGSCPGTGQRQ